MKSYKQVILVSSLILAFAMVPFFVDAERSYLVYSLFLSACALIT